MKNGISVILSASIIMLLIAGCSDLKYKDGPEKVFPERGKTVSVTENVKLSLDKVKEIVGDKNLCDELKYGVTCYKVRYRTLYENEMVDADALLIVPDYEITDTPRYAAYFHGTILPFKLEPFVFTGLPSDFKGSTDSKDIIYCALPLAAAGYCVVTPDYTGYGPTAGQDHPFIYYPELFKSAVDGLRACRNVLKDNLNVNVDDRKIWLSGWSQGAGLSLYAQREFESNGNSTFEVMANSTLAGPFNIVHFITDMMKNPNKLYLAIALYSWATYAINRFDENLQRPTDQLFRLDIYDQTGSLLVMSNTPEELFQDFFMKHISDGMDRDFTNALLETSTSSGWTPKANIYMFHGTDDILVPYFNMTDAVEGLKNSGKVTAFTEEGGGHDTFVPKYMARTIELFGE